MFGPGFCCIYTALTTRGHRGDGCSIVSKPRYNTAHLRQLFQCFTHISRHEASICPSLSGCLALPPSRYKSLSFPQGAHPQISRHLVSFRLIWVSPRQLLKQDAGVSHSLLTHSRRTCLPILSPETSLNHARLATSWSLS